MLFKFRVTFWHENESVTDDFTCSMHYINAFIRSMRKLRMGVEVECLGEA